MIDKARRCGGTHDQPEELSALLRLSAACRPLRLELDLAMSDRRRI
ncbi:MAG: hypothetical protein MZV49_13740 [Rhodopseudomonas palustris]|nr:hypothetical protein [Rhodopseudomonas palustris]